MPWVRMDDGYPEHPKVDRVGPMAAWLNVCAWSYCARNLTDGFVPAERVARLAAVPNPKVLARKLVEANLWETVDGGYMVHDYLVYNPSREQVLAERAATAKRVADYRARGNGSTPPPGNGVTAPVTSSVSTGVSNGVSTSPPVPGPIPSPKTKREDSAESLSASADESVDLSTGDDRVDEVYQHFKARIQPRSKLCPRKRIAARLKRFTVAELREGIDHFAEDPWWMEHNASRGADWFFESDRHAEQFLLLQARAPSPAQDVPRSKPPPALAPPALAPPMTREDSNAIAERAQAEMAALRERKRLEKICSACGKQQEFAIGSADRRCYGCRHLAERSA